METKPASTMVDFLEEVHSIPGGESVRLCIQCGTCSGSCPNVAQMDYPLRKIIALIRAGEHEKVLTSNSMWFCASCYLCTVRCPRDVKPTELMHALEYLATCHGLSTSRTSTPIMYRAFADSVRSNGRVHEIGMMMKFYLKTFLLNLRTNPIAAVKMVSLVKVAPMGLALLRHGRLPLRAKKIKGREQINTIIKKAQALGGGK